jgi:hypothetical protein
MAKRKLSKAFQIAGLRKALKNRKTPKQFLPSMRKRLARLTAAVAILFVLCGCAVRPVAAQAPVTIAPTQQSLAISQACTGAAQVYPVNNRNQTQHSFTIVGDLSVVTLQATIYGIDTQGNLIQISDSGYLARTNTLPLTLNGVGYYPQVEISITCTGGHFTVSYAGTAATPVFDVGSQLQTQIYKTITNGASAGTSVAYNVTTPFGNSGGVLILDYSAGAGPSGSTLTVNCVGVSAGLLIPGSPYTPATTSAVAQSFFIPPMPCVDETITYTAGGASSNIYELVEEFYPPGTYNPTNALPAHIASTTAASLKNGGGFVTTVNINTSAAGTVTLFDLAASACTGTPSTNVIAVITAIASSPPVSMIYNTSFVNGICVKASSASIDFTVGYQ